MSANFFSEQSDLIGWRNAPPALLTIEPWKPHTLDNVQWPPNYKAVYAWRIEQLQKLKASEKLRQAAFIYYSTRPAEFIMHWMDTYDPRKDKSKWIPFVFFSRQAEFVEFLEDMRHSGENGLVEKCRDMGATWLSCAYSVWAWLFVEGVAIGWGSRKEGLVDTIGDPDSIFEKMRKIITRLPAMWRPLGFDTKKHATFMKLINPANGATITGEAGDNIGRGGRKSMYFKDESAHYERPEKIQAALDDNTRVQIDISSVNGLGNVFHNKREAGIIWQPDKELEPGYTRVFIIDWRDHPEKTQEWYDTRRAKHEREGLLHLFAQEVERNYSAAISNTIIPAEYIEAAIDAHMTIPYLRCHPDAIPNTWAGSLDVADDGPDRNAMALRQWIILRNIQEWGNKDVGETTRKCVAAFRQFKGIKIQYDSIGIGAGVKSEFNRLVADGIISAREIDLIAWNAGAAVRNPFERVIADDDESVLNKDMFYNMKAQAWWSVRTRFYKTYQAVKFGVVYPADELISLDSTMPLLQQVRKELAQPTRGSNGSLKMIVEKKPDGMKSPNLADAIIQVFFPVDDGAGEVIIGSYGG